METIGTGDKNQSIFAGTHGTLEFNNIIITSGEGIITPGTCLGKITATGKYAIWDVNATDGRENLAGICGCTADATTSDARAFIYTHGAFNKAKLSADNPITSGIYLSGSIIITEEA